MSEDPLDRPEPDVPEPELEPRLGLSEFATTVALKPSYTAALRTYLRSQHIDPAGYYPLAQWRDYYQGMLTS